MNIFFKEKKDVRSLRGACPVYFLQQCFRIFFFFEQQKKKHARNKNRACPHSARANAGQKKTKTSIPPRGALERWERGCTSLAGKYGNFK